MKGERITTVLDIIRDGRLLILEFIPIILDPTQTATQSTAHSPTQLLM